jgi:hypothetical protein
MSKRTIAFLMAALLCSASTPALAYRRTYVGPRGGSVTRAAGPYRSGTAVRGPYGGGAVHTQGPYRSGTAVRGPYGGTAVHAQGPYRAGTAVRGPYGGAAVYGRGPYGARGVYSRPAYTWRGVRYARPVWNVGRVDVYRRGFYGYPGYRSYGMYYGLVPGLAAVSGLAFLSAGLLAASYIDSGRTVYVYVVNQGGQNVEYRVDEAGRILSQRVIY